MEGKHALLLLAIAVVAGLSPDLPTMLQMSQENPELAHVCIAMYTLLAVLIIAALLK